MVIYLLRHGRTEYNAQKRYQGQRDIPLSAESAAQLKRADFSPEVVYVTPLQRTSQTAKILFPTAKLVPVEGLKEMNFGRFEGQKFVHVEQDPEYLEWVRRNEASARVCDAFAKLVDEALARGEERLVIVAHGGTQMAAMERFAVPHKTFHEWCGPNAGGYVLDTRDWAEKRVLHVVKTVQYTEENS